MCWVSAADLIILCPVSVAGCLGYDVLESVQIDRDVYDDVSVAGCLGYDVLEL